VGSEPWLVVGHCGGAGPAGCAGHPARGGVEPVVAPPVRRPAAHGAQRGELRALGRGAVSLVSWHREAAGKRVPAGLADGWQQSDPAASAV